QKRRHPRVKLYSAVRLYDPDVESLSPSIDHGLTVYLRNISSGGIGFLYKGRIPAKSIVLCLDPDQEASTWFRAKIVRARMVHNDFWEYGAQFTGRSNPDEVFSPGGFEDNCPV